MSAERADCSAVPAIDPESLRMPSPMSLPFAVLAECQVVVDVSDTAETGSLESLGALVVSKVPVSVKSLYSSGIGAGILSK